MKRDAKIMEKEGASSPSYLRRNEWSYDEKETSLWRSCFSVKDTDRIERKKESDEQLERKEDFMERERDDRSLRKNKRVLGEKKSLDVL